MVKYFMKLDYNAEIKSNWIAMMTISIKLGDDDETNLN